MIRRTLAIGAITVAAALTFSACAKEPQENAAATTKTVSDASVPPVTESDGAVDEDLNVCAALTLDQAATVVGKNPDTEAGSEATTQSSCKWVSTSGPERSLELTVAGPEAFAAAKQQYGSSQTTADSDKQFVATKGSTVVAGGLTEDGKRSFVLVLTGASESETEALTTLLSDSEQALNDTTVQPETPQDPEQIDGSSSDANGG